MSGIYIHIPFCKQACSYCDFYFVTRDNLRPAFVDTLIDEVHGINRDSRFSRWFQSHPPKTLYIGGGTPSRLNPHQFHRITEAVDRRFNLSGLQEFTVEVNPEDLTSGLSGHLKQLGVTRLSMGIQSFQPDLLKFMNRAHTAEQAHTALERVIATGFDTFSVDLIYGNPGQTLQQLEDDLQQLAKYQPPHVSAYSLTIEPKTRLGKQYELGRLQPAESDEIARQAGFIRDYLAEQNIDQYEVSNYARAGHEALHNSAYWRHENYLGLGPAAHSFYRESGDDFAVRWHNPADIHAYLQGVRTKPGFSGDTAPARRSALPGKLSTPSPDDEASSVSNDPYRETLSLKTLAGERIMMGLRTVAGVSEEELASRYRFQFNRQQRRQIDQLREEELLEPYDPLRLTAEGMPLADAITLRLWQ